MPGGFTYEQLAAWARARRVSDHLTNGRADRKKCVQAATCKGTCQIAQAAADHFEALAS